MKYNMQPIDIFIWHCANNSEIPSEVDFQYFHI